MILKKRIPWNKGKKYTSKPCSEETKRKISISNKGRIHTLEARKHMSEAHIGNKGFWEGKSRTERTKHKISLTKINQKLTREKSNNWKGGISKIHDLIRRCAKYKLWREKIFERDNYTCKLCGAKGVYLNAHHLDAYKDIINEYKPKTITDAYKIKKLWDISNGITVCESCHKKIHFGGI